MNLLFKNKPLHKDSTLLDLIVKNEFVSKMDIYDNKLILFVYSLDATLFSDLIKYVSDNNIKMTVTLDTTVPPTEKRTDEFISTIRDGLRKHFTPTFSPEINKIYNKIIFNYINDMEHAIIANETDSYGFKHFDKEMVIIYSSTPNQINIKSDKVKILKPIID